MTPLPAPDATLRVFCPVADTPLAELLRKGDREAFRAALLRFHVGESAPFIPLLARA